MHVALVLHARCTHAELLLHARCAHVARMYLAHCTLLRCERTSDELFEPLEPILFAVAVGLQVLDGPVDMRLQALDGELALVGDPYLQSDNRQCLS